MSEPLTPERVQDLQQRWNAIVERPSLAAYEALVGDLWDTLDAARLSHDRGADALPPDIEALADLFMDLRLDGPAQEGWTYQQTARHYARIIQRALSVPWEDD